MHPRCRMLKRRRKEKRRSLLIGPIAIAHFTTNGTTSATKRIDARFAGFTWYAARYTIFR
jgi:hypothetical protein